MGAPHQPCWAGESGRRGAGSSYLAVPAMRSLSAALQTVARWVAAQQAEHMRVLPSLVCTMHQQLHAAWQCWHATLHSGPHASHGQVRGLPAGRFVVASVWQLQKTGTQPGCLADRQARLTPGCKMPSDKILRQHCQHWGAACKAPKPKEGSAWQFDVHTALRQV